MTHREASKKVWNSQPSPEINEINMGSLQRIADACELMSKNYAKLQEERDDFKSKYEWERQWRQDTEKAYERQVRALRGVITKLKKKAEV